MHNKLWNFVVKYRDGIILAFLTFILVEFLQHNFTAAASLGAIGLVLNSHLLCCIIPAFAFKIWHKKNCHCHAHGEEHGTE